MISVPVQFLLIRFWINTKMYASVAKAIEDQLEYWEKQEKIAVMQKNIAEARIEIQRQKKQVWVHRDSVDGIQEELLAKFCRWN